MTELKCKFGGVYCFLCTSAGKCLFQQSTPYMGKQCPITDLNCHDPLCEGNICLRDYPRERERCEGEFERKVILKQLQIIDQLTDKASSERKPLLVLITLINNQTFIMADIQLTLGATPKDGIFALLDTVTGGLLTGVTFGGQTVGANSNPSAATFAIDPADTTGNSVLPTPIAAGSGTCVFGATASYTDSKGNAQTNVPFTVVKNFTVILGADGVTLDIIF